MSLNLKKYKKIGLMGGTFDPIHNQHLFIANTALEKLNLDIILFIPTGKVPHKDNSKITSNLDRYNMTMLAINDNPKFFITDIETSSNKTNYTFETLQKIKDQTDATLYFIIGLDTLYTFYSWKNLDIIGKLCKIVNFNRPNYIESEKNKNIIEKYNLDIINIEDVSLSTSSTEVRNKLNAGESVKYLIPDNVINYIDKNNLYKKDYSELINVIDNDVKNILSKKRYDHTISVMNFAIKLAIEYNEDIDLIKIATLLHDYAKELSKEEKLKYIEDNNIYIDNYTKNNIDIAHGLIAKDIAFKKYNIRNVEILNAIEFHTTARTDMSNIEKITYLADKLEPNRYYDSLPHLTKLAFKDLDLAIYKSLEDIIKYTNNTGIQEHPLSIIAYDYYKKLSIYKTYKGEI